MKRTRSFIALLLVLVMVTMVLTACGSTKPADNGSSAVASSAAGSTAAPVATEKPATPTTIRFWNGWTGPDGDLLKKEVEEFNATNKDAVTVQMDIMQHSALTEKINASLASGTQPELYLGFANNDLAVNGQIMSIDDIWEKTGMDKADFAEPILNQMYYNGKLFGIPFQLSSMMLYWNKDLFKAAGLDPEVAPKTWEEMAQFSHKITNKAKNIYGSGPTFNDSMTFAVRCLSYGGKLIDGDKLENFKACMADPKYVEANKKAITFMTDMVKAGDTPTFTGAQMEAAFVGGTTGMLVSGAWMVAGCKKATNLNWGISLLPAGPEGIKQPGFPIAMVVMKDTKGDKLLATYKFIAWWNDMKNLGTNSAVYKWSQNQGYQPYLKSVAADPTLNADPVFKITNAYIDYNVAYYPVGFYKFLALGNDALVPLLESVAYNKKTIDVALADCDKKINEMIQAMKDETGK